MSGTIASTLAAVAGWTAFGLAILAGLVLNVVGLFGNWIILAAVALAWAATGFVHWGPWSILAMAGLALMGEVVEAIAAGYGAARFGGGRGAVISSLAGAIAGAVFGTPFLPVLGTLAGACVGAFLGALLHEVLLMRRNPAAAAWTGFGAALGRMGGTLAKFTAGVIMLILVLLTF